MDPSLQADQTPSGLPIEWLALSIGNSRLHWAGFCGDRLQQSWDTAYRDCAVQSDAIDALWDLQTGEGVPIVWTGDPELWILSVVPEQTQQWQRLSGFGVVQVIDRDRVPLGNMYATLGCDRAMAVWAAVQIYGAPVLTIDGGTALTLTGADDRGDLVGGAILPGLNLQLRSLGQSTAALPTVSLIQEDGFKLPDRWARNTPEAIQSGILYTVLAGLQGFLTDWWRRYPKSAVVLTGGDGVLLDRALRQQFPQLPGDRLHYDRDLIFRGMQLIRDRTLKGV